MAWLTAASSIIAVLAFTDSILTRYVRAKSRRYAAEHDFDIVRRELDSLKEVLDKVEVDVQRLERTLAVVEAVVRMKDSSVRIPPTDVA